MYIYRSYRASATFYHRSNLSISVKMLFAVHHFTGRGSPLIDCSVTPGWGVDSFPSIGELEFAEDPVKPIRAFGQFPVRALFHQPPLVQDQDGVRFTYSGKAVGDDN